MTLKRLLLGVLTLFALALMGFSLAESWGKPQIQGQLELRQTDLLLQASMFQPEEGSTWKPLQSGLLGSEPLQNALRDYKTARDRAVASQGDDPTAMRDVIASYDLKLGILQVAQSDEGRSQAQAAWQRVISADPPLPKAVVQTAVVLTYLWADPPELPNISAKSPTHQVLASTLSGWFRYRALAQLYTVKSQPDQLTELQAKEQAAAQAAMARLLVLAGIPSLGLLVGGLLLVGLVVQLIVQRDESILASVSAASWPVSWDWEIVWQVFILGFFWLGQFIIPQLVLPLLFKLIGIDPSTFISRDRALWIFISYGLVAIGGILTLLVSIKPWLPLPADWFRPRWLSPWLLWGIGGYLVATPIVILVSFVNQQLWQGQGGSNPILPIALNSHDPWAMAFFVITASVAAPLFEETMFRGFLLPSLTRYLPVWGAIGLSSVLFALAHLSLSEVLPLTALGMVLGFVYLRSRSLLAPILLHSLWNGGTLLSLLTLGSQGG